MYLTRTWAFAIHRQKLKMLGRWPEGRTEKTASHPHDPLTLTHNTHHETNDTSDIIDNANNSYITNNLDLINTISLPGCLTVPLPRSTTPLPATTTTSTTERRSLSLLVPADDTIIVQHYDHPPDSVPRLLQITNNCAVNGVEEEDKTGSGLGGSLPDVGGSDNSDHGYQQSVSAIESFFQSLKLSEQCSQHRVALE